MNTSTVASMRGALALAIVCALSVSGACAEAGPAADSLVSVARTTRLQAGDAVMGALPMAQPLQISVGLKMRDRQGLDAFIAKAAASRKAGVFTAPMTSGQFMATHAPTQAQVQAVVDYLTSRGFTNIQVASNRMAVTAQGTARTARDAFMTTFAQVRTRDGRIAYANTDEVRIPAALADTVRGVVGLQTVHMAHTFAMPRKPEAIHTLAIFNHYPDEFPTIYTVGTVAAATGTPVGMITQGNLTQTRSDLATFTSARSLAAVTTSTVNTDGTCSPTTSKACTSNTTEWDLDSQDIVGMSGGVSELIFYNIPALTDGDLYDDYTKIVSNDKVGIINAPVGECETDAQSDGSAALDDDEFAIAVAQGQTFSVATGDAGADECGDGGATPSWPAASQYVIAAAGTTLSVSSTDVYSSETVWSNSGGSPSTFEPMPSWQVGFSDTIGSTTYTVPGSTAASPLRDAADVAYDADPDTGAGVFVGVSLEWIGGTSLSSSLFAGSWARMLQQYPMIGFAGPVIYALPDLDLHDVKSGSNGGETAGISYDSASGRGSLYMSRAVRDADHRPTANFNYKITDLSVAFTDLSTDPTGVVSHAWVFGDGSTSTAADPVHVYATGGSYTVTETVKDKAGGSASKTRTLNVSSGDTPVANYNYKITGLSLAFTDESTDSGGTIVSHAWTFGDGSTSTDTDPVHVYAAPGTYTVVETVTDNTGATASKSRTINVIGDQKPTANFNYMITVLSVAFTDESTDSGTIVSWSWDFGDGSTSTETDPVHAYAAPGTYTVTETVKDNVGATAKKTRTINVIGDQKPVANFNYKITKLSVAFTDESTDTGTIVSWAWDFGDGSTSTETDPVHAYAASGTYTVTDTVKDNVGATAKKTRTITVKK